MQASELQTTLNHLWNEKENGNRVFACEYDDSTDAEAIRVLVVDNRDLQSAHNMLNWVKRVVKSCGIRSRARRKDGLVFSLSVYQ